MIKILIADDHPVVRRGLKQIISENPDMVVAGEAGDGLEVLSQVRKNDYDLVLLDISMPAGSGLSILSQIKSEKTELPVLIISIYPESQYAVRVLKAGASGYLAKDSAPEELIKAIRAVVSGKKYVSAGLAQELASKLGTAARNLPHETLSNREFDILCLIASGKTNKGMARDLFLSPKTVSTYRLRILNKLGLKTDAELIRYVIENRLLG